MGDRLRLSVRRLLCLGALLLPVVPFATACAPEDVPPDMSTREAFARSVMTAATSGSVEKVESLVVPNRINVRPEAQQLLDATSGWTPGSWELRLSNDFPEVANVEVFRNGQVSAVRYGISWSRERWALIMGQPQNPPSGGAGLGTRSGSTPKIAPTGGESVEPVPAPSISQPPEDCTVAGVDTAEAGLACQQFTTTSGNAAGENLHWLTSTPLHVSFSRMNAALTMVVRMPCGVLNVPVSVDAFGMTPDPAGLVQSADACTGPEAEQRSWTTQYFQSPLIYQLDARELVFTNELGQIRLRRD